MTQEIKTYYDLNEAIKNCEYKTARINDEQPAQYWIFVNYKDRVFYDTSNYNPQENKIVKDAMIKNIRDEAETIDRDRNFKIIN